ncbi:ParB/RepB/Spo0J family partition protein [Ewingella sp. S1.OA.A_B6]
MATLSQHYKQKDKNGTGTTVKKTYMVPYEELYTVEGEQGRPLNMEHAEKMRDLWIAGADLPALVVKVTEQGVKIIDGQHRYTGAGLAIAKGINIPRIECKDFIGSDLDELALQTGSSDSLQVTPIERATQYNKAKNRGYNVAEIAAAFHRSTGDVESYLQLLSSGDVLIGMVESGEVAATTAVALSREHGAKAGSVATEGLAKAKAAGKKKLTKSDAMPQFSAVKARRLVELLCDSVVTRVIDGTFLSITDEDSEEIVRIIAEYRNGIKPGTEAS